MRRYRCGNGSDSRTCGCRHRRRFPRSGRKRRIRWAVGAAGATTGSGRSRSTARSGSRCGRNRRRRPPTSSQDGTAAVAIGLPRRFMAADQRYPIRQVRRGRLGGPDRNRRRPDRDRPIRRSLGRALLELTSTSSLSLPEPQPDARWPAVQCRQSRGCHTRRPRATESPAPRDRQSWNQSRRASAQRQLASQDPASKCDACTIRWSRLQSSCGERANGLSRPAQDALRRPQSRRWCSAAPAGHS